MAIRQYIGARYVTKIYENSLDPSTAEWEPSVNYEPLTMVTYNNGSYLSKKEVPANIGNPASNTDYWVQTGFYNGQITFLQSEIDDINKQLEAQSPLLKDRKFILIGDSYNTVIHHGGWGAALINQLGLTLGTNVWNDGLGGTGFGTIIDNGGFSGQLSSVISGLTTAEKNSITDVIIAGGANDHSKTASEIQDGFTAVENLVNTHLPNATVTVICCGWSYETDTIRDGIIEAYKTYVRENKMFRIYNKAYTIFLNPYYLESDMVHPTEYGMAEMTHCIANLILHGSNYYPEYTDLLTTVSGMSIASQIHIYGNITESGYDIYKNDLTGLTFDDLSAITVPDNSYVQIGSIPTSNPNNFFERNAKFTCNVLYRLDGGTYTSGVAEMYVKKETSGWSVNLKNIYPTDGSNNFSVSNVRGIYPTFNVHLDVTKS